MSLRPSVLIVDDEESIRDSLEIFLSEQFQVSKIATADEAIEIARHRKFAVALVDIGLAGKSGVWLLKELRMLCPSCQVIMVTADHALERVVECYSLGAYGYIPKPWKNEATMWLVRRASERHRLTEKNDFLLARALRQPKAPGSKLRPNKYQADKLVASITKQLSQIDTSTMEKISEAQDALKRQVLIVAMQKAGWNQVHAARLLGIKRTTLRQNLGALGIAAPAQHGKRQI